MVRKFPRSLHYLFGFAIAIFLGNLCHAENETVFNTVQVRRRDYVNIADFVRYYNFEQKWDQKNQKITLNRKSTSLNLLLNSRECRFDGVRMWLNDPPIQYQNSTLLSEVDIRKTLHPLLCVPGEELKQKVKTIMIDPGHGGEDRGAAGNGGSVEKRLNIDVARRIEKLLNKAGFRTLMTRREDTYVSLEDRSDLTNSSEADLFLSIHFNSATPNTQAKGIETFCLTPSGLGSTDFIRKQFRIGQFGEEPGNKFDETNLLLAYLVQRNLILSLPNMADRGIRRARFHVIKATKCPSILVECGFLSNSEEEKWILSPTHRDNIAGAIVNGIKSYAELMNRENKSLVFNRNGD
jgi:N-acetylmuramoyl-L-alanine amidase